MSNHWEWFGILQRLCMAFPATRRQESLGTDPYPLRTSSNSPKKFRKSCRKIVEEFTADSTKNLHTSWQRLPKLHRILAQLHQGVSKMFLKIVREEPRELLTSLRLPSTASPENIPPGIPFPMTSSQENNSFRNEFLEYFQIFLSKNAQGKPLEIEPESSKLVKGSP